MALLIYVVIKKEKSIFGQLVYKHQHRFRVLASIVLLLIFGIGVALTLSAKGQEYTKFVFYGTPTLTPSQTRTATSSPTRTPTSSPRPISDSLYYMIVFDSSINMNESSNGESKWQVARNLLVEILNALNPRANFSVIAIGGTNSTNKDDPCNSPQSVSLSFASRQDAYNYLGSLQPQGGGSFYRAFALAKNQFQDLPKDTIKTLIFITGTSDTCETEDEWVAIRNLMSISDSTFQIYSQVIVLDDSGIKSRTLAEQFESLSNENINVDVPQSVTDIGSLQQIPGFNESVAAPKTFFSTNNPNVSAPDAVGKMILRYTHEMLPNSNDSVDLSIYIPEELVGSQPSELLQKPPVFGELTDIDQYIGVSRNMRVELSSLSSNFDIRFVGDNSKQEVEINKANSYTNWKWAIRAPQTTGEEKLLLKIYFNNDDTAVLFINLSIVVSNSTATPGYTPTTTRTVTVTLPPTPKLLMTSIPAPTYTLQPTSTPWYELINNNLKDNASTWLLKFLGGIGAIFAAIFGVIKKQFSRNDKVTQLQEELVKLKGNASNLLDEKYIQRKSFIDEEIRRLKATKWWQFWK